MVDKISDAERALLTEEELEGLLEDEDADGDEDDGDGGDGAGDAGDTNVGDGTGTPDEGGKPNADPAAADTQPGADASAAAPTAAPVAAAEPDPAVAAPAEEPADPPRTPAWVVPAEVGERIKAIDAERDRLAVEFDEGALTAAELRERQRALENERDDLRTRQISAQVALDTAKSTWLEQSVPTFLRENPQYRNPVLNQALDAEVRKMQVEAVNPFDPKILEKAHAKITGELTQALNIKKDPPPPLPTDPNTKPTTKRPPPPPTLAHVPAADITDADDGGEFAYLDRLADTDSVAYERELAKLSPEKQDRYLAQ